MIRKQKTLATLLAAGLSLSNFSGVAGIKLQLADEESVAPVEETLVSSENDQSAHSQESVSSPEKSTPSLVVAIDETFFPDEAFRNIVSGFDTDGDGTLSQDEIGEATSLSCPSMGIRSLEGISYLVHLTELDCSDNTLSKFDISENPSLWWVNCSGNQITELDISNNAALGFLDCSSNKITSLTIGSSDTLYGLLTHGNNITELDVSSCKWLVSIMENGEVKDFGTYYAFIDPYKFDEPYLSFDKTVKVTPDFEKPTPAPSPIAINDKNFPDKAFRQVVGSFDTDGDGKLNSAEITAAFEIDCFGMGIKSLAGIEYFTRLSFLYCGSNELTSLDISKNTKLNELDCSNNQITKLDLSKNTDLSGLNCSYNKLTSLDVSALVSLNTLFTHENSIKKLDVTNIKTIVNVMEYGEIRDRDTYYVFVDPEKWDEEYFSFDKTTSVVPGFKKPSPTPETVLINEMNFPDESFRKIIWNYDYNEDGKLSWSEIRDVKEFSCPQHNIHSLQGIEYFLNLQYLDCSKNMLTSLDLSKNINLTILICRQNDLTKLDLQKNTELNEVDCSQNAITKLVIKNSLALTSLNCYLNKLTELDISKNTLLTHLDCSSNSLSKLGIRRNHSLEYLDCSNNSIEKLDVTTAPNLLVLLTHTNKIPKLDVSNCETILKIMNYGEVQDRGTYYAFIDPDKTDDDYFTFDKTTEIEPGFRKPSGTPTPTQAPSTPTPTPTEAPHAEGFEGFVERLYQLALEREPDPEGKAYWVKHVKEDGATGADCARFFLLDSPEFLKRGQNNDQFLETLYAIFFGRASDTAGKKFWMDKLNAGTPKSDVVNGFIESTEWCDICAGFGVKSGAKYHKATTPSANATAFATRLYTKCLCRDPEEGGLKYWALALTNLDKTAAEAAQLFFNSKEFLDFKTSDEFYLGRLYYTFMDRAPDQGGVKFWLDKLAQGSTRNDVLKQFAESPEFTEICNQYGIDRGTIS